MFLFFILLGGWRREVKKGEACPVSSTSQRQSQEQKSDYQMPCALQRDWYTGRAWDCFHRPQGRLHRSLLHLVQRCVQVGSSSRLCIEYEGEARGCICCQYRQRTASIRGTSISTGTQSTWSISDETDCPQTAAC